MTAAEQAAAFNARIAAFCDSHAATEHHTCERCGVEWCAYWTESDECPECPRTTFKVELANKIVGGRAVGNLWGVGRYKSGNRCGWALEPQADETVARDFVTAREGKQS